MIFDTAVSRVLLNEGGYVNNPKDPGGETRWGISKRQYPHLDIKNLTRDQARDIYFLDYWKAFGCDQYDPRIGFQIFDAAVNHPPREVAKMLQRAVKVTVDGVIGAKTVGAVRAMKTDFVIARFLAARLRFWAQIPGDEFDDGWMNRAADNLDFSTEM